MKLNLTGFPTYGRNIGGLKDVSLRIKAGEKLGVVGASGAGKSTLVSTLLRLHDAESGSILIDGQNIADVKQNSLRRNISMVTQEASMFNRTAREIFSMVNLMRAKKRLLMPQKRLERTNSS